MRKLVLGLSQIGMVLLLYGIVAFLCVSMIGNTGWIVAGVAVMIGLRVINHDAKLMVSDPLIESVYRSPLGSLAASLFYGGLIGVLAILLCYIYIRLTKMW